MLMSSFRRAGASVPPPALPGTRDGISRVTSFGHGVVDAILGGGVSLGSLIVVDCGGRHAEGHAATLASLFLSQGVGSSQTVCVIGHDSCGIQSVDGFASSLPYDLSVTPQAAPSATDAPANPLSIAWQYGKYLSTDGVGTGSVLSRSGAPRPVGPSTPQFCHKFDLARVLPAYISEAVQRYVPVCSDASRLDGQLVAMLSRVRSAIAAADGACVSTCPASPQLKSPNIFVFLLPQASL